MEQEKARQEVRAKGLEILSQITPPAKQKVNGKTSYVCPFCGHGSNGDGITENPQSRDGHGLKCFGCDFSGDIIDLIKKRYNLDFNAALEEAAGYIGITIDKTSIPAQITPPTKPEPLPGQQDYTNFFLTAKKHNTGEYLQGRGISKATQDRFNVGYVGNWKHPKASENVRGNPYIIFPTSETTYSTRYTGTDETVSKYKKMHVGKNAPFFCGNAAIESDKPVFVVEGETDALSLWELDYSAIALGSVSFKNKFVEFAAEHRNKFYIIALDSDQAGKKVIKEIDTALNEKGIAHTVADINGVYKDPNERLQKDRKGLEKALELFSLQATDPEEYKKAKIRKNNVNVLLGDFWERIINNTDPPISTGFNLLDEALDGGFFPEQLLFLGAVSSLGKTTFLLQVCDNIAAAGTPVLLFSLEMSSKEIMAKSISRYTCVISLEKGVRTNNAKTMRGIIAGYRHKTYSQAETDLIREASSRYSREAGKNLYIYEGNGNTGVEEIKQTVNEFIRLTGKSPVVFIDYLQILSPYNPKMTDKQNTDQAVKVLKQMARDSGIAVIAISSLNRENYYNRISMQAFKESGAIEYSSDVLLGMQFNGAGTSDFDISEAKRKNPREVEVHFLKNRNGLMPKPILYNYYPMFNYYQEIGYTDPYSDESNSSGTKLHKIK